MITAKYGSKQFETSLKKIYTPDGLSFSESIEYEEVAVKNKKPTISIKGVKLQDLSFDVMLDARFVDIENEFTWWRNKLLSKKSDTFTLGNSSLGKFFLTDISRSDIVLAKNGKMLKAKLSLTFKEDGAYANDVLYNQPKVQSVKNSSSSTSSKTIAKGAIVKPKANTRWYRTAVNAYNKTGKYGKAYNKQLKVTYTYTYKKVTLINPQGLGWMRPEDVDVIK